MMHVGLLSLVNHNSERRGDDAIRLVAQIDQAVLAERVALDSFWIAEHHACDYGGIASSNVVLAAAIASRTSSIRLGSGAAILTLHDPFELAEQWAMVDCISGGRVEFGMARAFLPYEFDLFGVDMDESRDRFVEAVDIVKHAWAGGDLGYTGRFRSLPSVGPMSPLPVQSPHPPMWVTAAMTPETFEWAGAQGYGLMITPYSVGLERMRPLLDLYCESYDAAGHDPAKRRIQATYHLLLADSVDEACRLAQGPINRYMQSFVEAAGRGTFASASYANYDGMLAAIAKLDFDGLFERERLVIGTPETAIQQMGDVIATSPITDLTFMVDFGDLEPDTIDRTIELLGAEVAPALRLVATP